MPQPPHLPSLDARVRVAWQAQVAAAGSPLGLLPTLGHCQPELLPRFVASYAQLRALPRRVRRALQRQWRLPLAGVALLLALGQRPGLAATIPVGGACTLVDAITAANTDTATGGCPAGSGADTIVLPAGSTQTLIEVNNSTYGPTGLPVISSVITIAGQGSTIVRDSGAPEFRILEVNSTGALTLQETTVSGGVAPGYGSGGGVANFGGMLTLTNSTIAGNTATGSGGGVANFFSGTLTLTNSTIAGNTATDSGGGVADFFSGTLTLTNSTLTGNTAGSGGGVYNGGTLTLTNSTLAGNTATGSGGGVYNGGTLTLTNSTLTGNTAGSGGGVANFGGTLTLTNSTLTGNTAGIGGGVYNYGSTFTITNSTIMGNSGGGVVVSVDAYGRQSTGTLTNSTIAGNTAGGGGGVYNSFGNTLTITNSTITGNSASGDFGDGGGVGNRGTLTITNSTIAGNTAGSGGGVVNGYGGTLTITNSTITGNSASGDFGDGGGVGNRGTLTITNSTIAGNTATGSGGGVVNVFSFPGVPSTLTLVRTLVAGNRAPIGPEVFNNVSDGSTVLADNHNLFGLNGTAGVEGFTPGPTDIVPPASVQLADILNLTLANNGGATQTHALVPGSPAIDAGGPDCTDATGEPLPTDQRGRPRVVDGNGDGTAACDIGAFEFFPIVNDFVTLDPALDTNFDPTAVPGGPAGTFTITAMFTNTSDTPLRLPFFTVTEISGDNLLLNAAEGTQGVGATLTPDVGGSILAPGETVTVDFVIGLHTQEPFTFFVDLFGEPVS